MPTFKGFNTIGQVKKFGLTDFELIKRDLLNAFLIREGQLPGRPELGTKIWNFVFDPLDAVVRAQIEKEVRRIINMDPRLEIDQLDISTNQNTVIIEVRVTIRPDMSSERLFLVFNQDSDSANIIS
jgi:phage baseplate assembly protein W